MKYSGFSNPSAYTPVNIAVDTDLIPLSLRGLYIGSGGDVAVVIGSEEVILTVPEGAMLPIRCDRINGATTTASGIIGLV
jgi:hypothetical protein